ncbi:MAG: reverse transcriptase family protein [Limisphaerales bacterium]
MFSLLLVLVNVFFLNLVLVLNVSSFAGGGGLHAGGSAGSSRGRQILSTIRAGFEQREHVFAWTFAQQVVLEELTTARPKNDPARVPHHDLGLRRGRSIRTGAEPHVGKRFVLKLDLKDFFPTVTCARVRGLLIAYGYSYPVATTLAVVMTEAERQPVEVEGSVFHVPVGQRHCVQGAPTSPGICNALLLRLDHRLAGLAKKRGLVYTRYADDLTFSGEVDRTAAHKFRTLVNRIVFEEGFVIHPDKTRLMGQGNRQTVTGVVVNRTLGLSRQERRRLRACISPFVQLGSFEKGSQAGVIHPVATGWMTVRAGTFAPRIRCDVMRSVARSACAHCPKLEPLLEHDNLKIIVARIPQV